MTAIDSKSLGRVVEIAEKYGNGVIDITNRQGIEIPGIRLEDVDKVNAEVQLIIDSLRVNQTEEGKGYPASGSCFGNPERHCLSGSAAVPVRLL